MPYIRVSKCEYAKWSEMSVNGAEMNCQSGVDPYSGRLDQLVEFGLAGILGVDDDEGHWLVEQLRPHHDGLNVMKMKIGKNTKMTRVRIRMRMEMTARTRTAKN